jgi:hypothetical protein
VHEEFYFSIYNYGDMYLFKRQLDDTRTSADDRTSEYCNPETTCINDGHQFLGLRALALNADQEKKSAKGKKKSTTKRAEEQLGNNATDYDSMLLPRADDPTTPLKGITAGMSDTRLNPATPQAPKKTKTPKEVQDWFDGLLERV